MSNTGALTEQEVEHLFLVSQMALMTFIDFQINFTLFLLEEDCKIT
jgi:hypothetical protein